MSIIVAPDSFKGSLTAQEFCSVAKEVLQRRYPQQTVHTLPLADGGEGTLDCILAAVGGQKQWFETVDALGAPITAPIGFLSDGTAVIESATAIGLPQLKGREDPMAASTYGLGLLIAHAIEAGATEITLTLGGSATNDLGLGMLQALGWRFYDAAGEPITPRGGNLAQIAKIEPSRVKASFTAMCDVENPLLGAQGAAAVFAPQALPMWRRWNRARKMSFLCWASIPMPRAQGRQAGWAMLAFIVFREPCGGESMRFCACIVLKNCW